MFAEVCRGDPGEPPIRAARRRSWRALERPGKAAQIAFSSPFAPDIDQTGPSDKNNGTALWTHWAVVQLKEADSALQKQGGEEEEEEEVSRRTSFRSRGAATAMQQLTLTMSVYMPLHESHGAASSTIHQYKKNLLRVVHRTNQLLLLHGEFSSCFHRHTAV